MLHRSGICGVVGSNSFMNNDILQPPGTIDMCTKMPHSTDADMSFLNYGNFVMLY